MPEASAFGIYVLILDTHVQLEVLHTLALSLLKPIYLYLTES